MILKWIVSCNFSLSFKSQKINLWQLKKNTLDEHALSKSYLPSLKALLVFTPKEEDILTSALQNLGTNDKAVEKLQKMTLFMPTIWTKKAFAINDTIFISKMGEIKCTILNYKAV